MPSLPANLPGFPWVHVTTDGLVYSLRRHAEPLMLKPFVLKNGAQYVNLKHKSGKMRQVAVAVAVAQVYMGFKGGLRKLFFRNGNPRDCRLENLTLENLGNGPAGSDRYASSQYRGVTVVEEHRATKYTAAIMLDGQRYHLGTHPTEAAAAIAYNHAVETSAGKRRHRFNDVGEFF